MKYTLNQVRVGLTQRAEKEWNKLKEMEDKSKLGMFGGQELNEQRARWAAWDKAAQFAKGNEGI